MNPLLSALELLAGACKGGRETVPPVVPEGGDPRNLALHFGLRLRRVRLYQRRWWRRDNGPLLAFRREDDAPVVLTVATDMNYRLHQPANGAISILDGAGAADLGEDALMPYLRAGSLELRAWTGRAMTCGEQDRHRYLLSSVVESLLALVPAAVVLGLDRMLDEGRRDILGLVILTLLVAAGSRALFGYSCGIASLRWRGRANVRVHALLWDRILDISAAAYRQVLGWQLSVRFRAALGSAHRELDASLSVQRGVISLAIAAGFLGVALPAAVPGAVVALSIAFVFQVLLGAHARSRMDRAEELRAQASHDVNLVARFLPQLRTLGQGDWLLSKAEGDLTRAIVAAHQAATARAVEAMALSIGPVLVALATLASVVAVRARYPTIGSLGCALLVALIASCNVVTLADAVVARRSYRRHLNRIAPIMEKPAPMTAAPSLPGPIERIEFENVSFRYPGAPDMAVDRVSLSIPHGEILAIAGPSGAGKSTLARLLLGLEEPSSGGIRINGRDLRALDTAAYRRRVGAVFQDQFIGYVTVRTAILGMAPLSTDDAWAAARLVQLEDVIAGLPMGMETIVAEGAFPAGYQKQLLIARALSRSPEVLVLDEAMTPLEEGVQQHLITDLRRLGTTVILCAHRPSTLALADRVVRLSYGRIERIDDAAALER